MIQTAPKTNCIVSGKKSRILRIHSLDIFVVIDNSRIIYVCGDRGSSEDIEIDGQNRKKLTKSHFKRTISVHQQDYQRLTAGDMESDIEAIKKPSRPKCRKIR